MRPIEIMKYCLDKPQAHEDRPFGEFPICYKLNEKIFAQLYPLEHDYKITLKCTREAGEFYRTVYSGQVVRGYHCPPVQQPYWNTVHLTNFPKEELWNMIDLAYETVLRSFPKKVQRQLEEIQMESADSLDNVRYYHMPEKIHYLFLAGDVKPVFTGVTLHPLFSSPCSSEIEKEAILNLAEHHDIHLTLVPQQTIDFYTVPHVEIFATDNNGGYLVSKESGFSFDYEEPVYYISHDKQCYLAASSGNELLEKGIYWKDTMTQTKDIEIFDSRQMAEAKYEILDMKYT